MSDSTTSTQALSVAQLRALGDHVYCDDELRLEWRRIDDLPQEPVLARCNARNETMLRAFAMLEEHDVTQADGAERAEFHRLEGKLDLALELLADVVREREQDVSPVPVRFNMRGLCWSSPKRAESGELLRVDCHLLPPWPLPLRLYAQVVGVERQADLWLVCSRLQGLTPGVEDWLAKLVFRRHRRQVARQRSRNHRAVSDRHAGDPD